MFGSHFFYEDMVTTSLCPVRLFGTRLRFGGFDVSLGNALNFLNVVTCAPYLEKEDDAQYGTYQDYSLCR